MVGPSLTDEEHRLASLRFKLVLVLIIGVSPALVALQVGATLPQVAIALALGLALGWVLVAYLYHIVPKADRRY